MTAPLRELIRLWLRQKRKDFHWKNVFLALYFGGLYVAFVLAFYFGFHEELTQAPMPPAALLAVPLAAIGAQLGDLLMKLFWRRSPVEMDDYLRSRPIPARAWSRFVLLDTAQGFLQWMLALMLALVAALLLPWWAAVLTAVLVFSVSLTNALFQNCWRRAPGNEWTLPLVFGYLVWTVLQWGLCVGGITLAVIRAAAAQPEGMTAAQAAASEVDALPFDAISTPMAVQATLLASALLLTLNTLVCWLLHRYFTRMKNHNEEAHAPAATASVMGLGNVSLWSIEWVQLLRSKRLRLSFFFIAGIFLLNTYIYQSPDTLADFRGINLMLFFGVGFPSMILAQWVLGVEANYISGIWTRPWSVEGILRRKYLFLCGLCVLMTLLLLPAVIWLHLSPLTLVATLLFACGAFLLPFMATCLFSSRMDLFASAFFNYQGANKQLNFFSFIMFLPMAAYYAAYFLLPPLWSDLLVAALGLAGLVLARPYIHWVYTRWYKRRYERMEQWMAE